MEKNSNQSHDSVHRTRSQAAPEWTMNSSLILLNEIAAVEGDCKNALSSFQKWKIIAENCTALDVARNVNQCRRKWNSLQSEYRKIDQWESQTGVGSYWSLGSEKRKELGLPESFDNELYTAICNLLRAREDQLDSEPDHDTEGEADTVDFTAESGSKRAKRLLIPPKGCQKEKFKRVSSEETPNPTLAELMPKKSNVEKKRNRKSIEGKQHMDHAKEKRNSSFIEVGPQNEGVLQVDCIEAGPRNEGTQEDGLEVGPQNGGVQEDCVEAGTQNDTVHEDCMEAGPQNQRDQENCVKAGPEYERVQEDLSEDKEEIKIEDNEQMMTAKLHASAKMILAIVNENLPQSGDNGPSGLKSANDHHTVFIRRQGDKLISCLEDIVNTLSQLGDIVQD